MARKTDDTPPKKEGTISRLKQIYAYTKKGEPKITLYLLLALLGPIALSVPFMFLLNNFIFPEIFGLLIGMILSVSILSRVADRVGYASILGKAGAAGAVLNTITQAQWSFSDQPVAVNHNTKDLVYRGVGRPGVILVSEGPINRLKPMMSKEEQKIKRVIPNITIVRLYSGDDPGQVPIKKLRKKILKLKKTLTKAELAAVKNRLQTLGTFRPPIPQGIDPFKVRASRKNIR